MTVSETIPSGDVLLVADLAGHDAGRGARTAAGRAGRGLIIFAHGSGSGRQSPRNLVVAERLQTAGFATLLVDLLTPAEQELDSRTRHLRFDIPLLAERLTAAVDWAVRLENAAGVGIGLYGASTGAAAALIAAGARAGQVAAVVSRGGRPDLAGAALTAVRAPTLLIVGSRDEQVLALNRDAQARMTAVIELSVVPGATHLFEEPGALEEVTALTAAWFERWLPAAHPGDGGFSPAAPGPPRP
jgi:putative phosphoribosyl transferase